MEFLEGKKTHLVVVFGLIAVLGAFLTGDMNAQDAIVRGLELLGLSTLRIGVAASK